MLGVTNCWQVHLQVRCHVLLQLSLISLAARRRPDDVRTDAAAAAAAAGGGDCDAG